MQSQHRFGGGPITQTVSLDGLCLCLWAMSLKLLRSGSGGQRKILGNEIDVNQPTAKHRSSIVFFCIKKGSFELRDKVGGDLLPPAAVLIRTQTTPRSGKIYALIFRNISTISARIAFVNCITIGLNFPDLQKKIALLKEHERGSGRRAKSTGRQVTILVYRGQDSTKVAKSARGEGWYCDT